MKFTIERSKWYRGKGSLTSKLLISDKDDVSKQDIGKMCCLGQVALQSGIETDYIKSVSAPCNMDYRLRGKLPKWIQDMNNGLRDVDQAMLTNDNPYIEDDLREARLKELFSRNGDEIEFVD